jgi:mannitol-1-/sugar-/sorbitol-6-phosphatase
MTAAQLFPGRRFAAFLFDMDGTLINSIAAANRVWSQWATGRGLDPAHVLSVMHGKRVPDTMRRLGIPDGDIERESAIITTGELEDLEGVVEIPGAARFVRALPPERWAIVTSAPHALALRRLEAAGVPTPRVLVAAEDVSRGKPAPDGFLLAARLLDVAPEDCLVWEDTMPGIGAAEAAGAAAVVISATHETPLATDHPTIIDYKSLLPTSLDGLLTITSV